MKCCIFSSNAVWRYTDFRQAVNNIMGFVMCLIAFVVQFDRIMYITMWMWMWFITHSSIFINQLILERMQGRNTPWKGHLCINTHTFFLRCQSIYKHMFLHSGRKAVCPQETQVDMQKKIQNSTQINPLKLCCCIPRMWDNRNKNYKQAFHTVSIFPSWEYCLGYWVRRQ